MNLLNHDWQLYGAVYLGAGVVTLLVALAANWRNLRPDSQSLASLIEAANPKPQTLWYRIRAKVLAPFLGGTLMVLLWPVVPIMKLQQWWADWRAEIRRREDVFKVKRPHLLERLTVAEIEARERVDDPAQAVPALPFGHLNEAWRSLIDDLAPGDECWSFSAQWSNEFGRPELRTGYVLWRGRKPVGHILTMVKRQEELPAAARKPKAAERPLSMEGIEIPEFLRKQAD